MCFQKPRRLPKHLLLAPEPKIHRRPHVRRYVLLLTLVATLATGVAAHITSHTNGSILAKTKDAAAFR